MFRLLLLSVLVAALSGCATTSSSDQDPGSAVPRDQVDEAAREAGKRPILRPDGDTGAAVGMGVGF